MEQFYTKIDIPKSPFAISLGDVIFSLGSCFATEMSAHFKENLFSVDNNPYGTLYNPLSIIENLTRTIERNDYSKEDFFHYNEMYYSLSHHTGFQGYDSKKLLGKITKNEEKTRLSLKRSNILIITLGTAWYYQLVTSKKTVANCHKLPSKLFERKLLTPANIIIQMEKLMLLLEKRLPQIKVIYTVSPIRHLRDSATNNSRSKGALLYAVQEVCEQHTNGYYFPSFEILIDELRDYRFYNYTLSHPSSQALEYIWRKLQEALFTSEAKAFIHDYQTIKRAKAHRFQSPVFQQAFFELK